MPKKTTSDEFDKQIIQEYSVCLSMVSLIKKYNISKDIIARILKSNNIEIKSNLDNGRKYFFNQNYFHNIDSEDKAYFLGFISADGHNNIKNRNLAITLNKKDEAILHILKKSINYSGPIWKSGNRVGISLCSKKLSQDLLVLGLDSNKTFSLKFPNISHNLIHHFIRGYFDGDGCITYNKSNKNWSWGIIGTDDFNTSLQNILMSKLDLNLTKLYKCSNNHSISRLIYNGNKQVYKIGKFMYNNSTIFIERKRNRFLELNSIYE